MPATTASKRSYLWLKVATPILIGLGVVLWLFHHEFHASTWDLIHFTPHVIISIFVAWLFMLGRDFGLTWRFRALTDHDLTWKQALKVDMLCEFTSCVTPSAVGGSALGMIYLNREGIDLGRATTLMMTTLFLDELFFVLAVPIVVAIIPYDQLFHFSAGHQAFGMGLKAVFWTVYGILFLWTLTLFMGIILKPLWVKKTLTKLFHWRLLRRWEPDVVNMADNMIATSAQLRKKPIRWWLETFGGTALSWSSRFLMVNALFWGFVHGADQLVVFGRQFVVWVVLMVSPTPGGSGVSGWLFTEYYGDMIAGAGGTGVALIIALFWRLLSYYVYLIIGICLLPGFFSRPQSPEEAREMAAKKADEAAEKAQKEAAKQAVKVEDESGGTS